MEIPQNVMKTPEEDAAFRRRCRHAESMRKHRQKLREQETPKQTEERRFQQREKIRKYRQILQAKQTPEQAAKRRLKKEEYQKKYRQTKRIKMETPEDAEEKRLKKVSGQQKYRQMKRSKETPEDAVERRIKRTEESRKYRQKKRARTTIEQSQVASKTTIKNEAIVTYENIDVDLGESYICSSFRASDQSRIPTKGNCTGTCDSIDPALMQHIIIKKRKPKKQKGTETPEQAAARRFKLVEERKRKKRIKYHELQGATETPEQAEIRKARAADRERLRILYCDKESKTNFRRLKKAEYMRNFRRKQKELETPEQAKARRLKIKTQRRYRREKKWLNPDANKALTEGQTRILPKVINEVNSDESWSSYSGSEVLTSQPTYNGNSTTEFKLMQNYLYTSSEQNSQLFIEKVKIKSEIQDSILQNNLTESDEHLEFVASIVEKLRTCNRRESDIDIAKKCIDEILFNLSVGIYKGVNSDECVTQNIRQTVIVKEEVDF